MDHTTCPVCGSPLKVLFKLRFNVYKCNNCGLLHSDAQFEHSFESALQAGARDPGLKALRLQNFITIIAKLKATKGGDLNGLEIGSGNGWWLETCQSQRVGCIGIEPEHVYEDYHKEKKLDVIYGFYPDVSPKKENGYDFIIFNDVFEHIPDINSLVESLKQDLADDGILIINIPMSTGFFYRIATLLHKFGMNSSLTRMWQFNFHSPHMNYFNEGNMKMLLDKHDFNCIDVFKLKSLDMQSTKDRMLADKGMSKWKASLMALALKMMKPTIDSSEPDIKAFFFRKK
ncbi:class I SAM-dependent methyltransferase [Mucilaginibacter sp.]|jgi:SAM-dependent methyltransferase|uniref:class I SAM-dependent methyltransferase n=1 Tax=Mucilaginibacter sp. TaxID=1882438 RepID=UPI002C430FD8|nr:class I SAM-dependent methyltransferase [Mucilaginibacter sp.]HTI58783.1 class I SAM-dependent methyltransferase [Mucilaginibacter sp.]